MKQMNCADILQALYFFVLGACFDHNDQNQNFAVFTTEFGTPCGQWVQRVYAQCKLAVFQDKFPNGGNSDFEADLMLKVSKLFNVKEEV